ncbi:MAG: 4-hydroxy-tetrahydrodipicolinate reductase [Woeseiaceae bacterium]
MLKLALIGAGRMGKAIMRQVAASNDLQLTGICVRPGNAAAAGEACTDAGISEPPRIVTAPAELPGNADVVVDFSLPDANRSVLEAAVAAHVPLVCGVTGLDQASMAAIRDASSRIPILYDRNMSIGIAVMQNLLRQAAASLGSEYTASIDEIHHRHKVDAPSGTALKLGETLAGSRGQDFTAVYHYDPDGTLGEPAATDIVFTVSRLGENPGEHAVTFANDMESLELRHKVTDRQVFASGALRAARWLVSRQPGLYSIADIAVDAGYGG